MKIKDQCEILQTVYNLVGEEIIAIFATTLSNTTESKLN